MAPRRTFSLLLLLLLLAPACFAASVSPSSLSLPAGLSVATSQSVDLTFTPAATTAGVLNVYRTATCTNLAPTTLVYTAANAAVINVQFVTTLETGSATRYLCFDADGAGPVASQNVATIYIFTKSEVSTPALALGLQAYPVTITGKNFGAPATANFYLSPASNCAAALSNSAVTYAGVSGSALVRLAVSTASSFGLSSTQAAASGTGACTLAAAGPAYICGTFQSTSAFVNISFGTITLTPSNTSDVGFVNSTIVKLGTAQTVTIGDANLSFNQCTRFKVVRLGDSCSTDASSLATVDSFSATSAASLCFFNTGCNLYAIRVTTLQAASLQFCVAQNAGAWVPISGNNGVTGIPSAQGTVAAPAIFQTAPAPNSVRTATIPITYAQRFNSAPRLLFGFASYTGASLSGSVAVDTNFACTIVTGMSSGTGATLSCSAAGTATSASTIQYLAVAQVSNAVGANGLVTSTNGSSWNSTSSSKNSTKTSSINLVGTYPIKASVAFALCGVQTLRAGSTSTDYRPDVFSTSFTPTTSAVSLSNLVTGGTRVNELRHSYVAGSGKVDATTNSSGYVVYAGSASGSGAVSVAFTSANLAFTPLLPLDFKAAVFIKDYNSGPVVSTLAFSVGGLGQTTDGSGYYTGLTFTIVAPAGGSASVSWIAIGRQAPAP